MRESGREAKGPQSTSDATSENQDTGTSAPSFLSVYRYAVLFASSLTAYACVIQLNCPRRDFAQKAKSPGGTLVTRAYIKESTYS